MTFWSLMPGMNGFKARKNVGVCDDSRDTDEGRVEVGVDKLFLEDEEGCRGTCLCWNLNW